MIVFTEGWCLMDNTRAILVGHVSVHKYAERPILILRKVQSDEKATTCLGEDGLGTFSVKYSNMGVYLQPLMSSPLNWPTFLNLAFFGSLYKATKRVSRRM